MTLDIIISKAIEEFCIDFVNNPYLCYTEHGIHAYFYSNLYNTIPRDQKYVYVRDKKMCIIQKEYPTNHNLGKSKRQNWDIAVIAPEQINTNSLYDFLKLDSVIEFGLNEPLDHLKDDLERLSHQEANVRNKYVVHLHRISGNGMERVSGRDWSPRSKRIVGLADITQIVVDSDVVIYYAIFDESNTLEMGVWKVTSVEVIRLC